MTAVIEQKLRAYERKYAIRDDVTLIVALRELLAAEEEREDCDWDAVAEMTDAILTLEGEDVGSFEASAEDAASFRAGAGERLTSDVAEPFGANELFGAHGSAVVNEAPETSAVPAPTMRPRASKKLKWIIPIAAVLAALLVGGAIAATYFFDLFSMDADTYKKIPVGTVVTEDGEELEKTDSRRTLDGYAGLDGDRYATLLVPVRLPDGWRISKVVTDELSNASLVETFIDAGEGRTVRVKALLGLGADLGAATRTLGGREVVVSEYDGTVQGEFTCGEDYYLIQTNDRALLETAIACMEVKK